MTEFATGTPTAAPVVSAMMPAYNAAATIGEAVAAVRAQTFADWELVVVDDGSTDGTADAVAAAAAGDPRVRCHRLARNVGRGAARNAALALCRGEFVAITDADDVSLPERFARQVAYLRAHPRVGVLGAQLLYFSEGQELHTLTRYPVAPADIARQFRAGKMGVAHSATMLRRDVFDRVGPYSEECRRAQDLELLLRVSDHFQFAGLPDVLVLYRSDPRRHRIGFWISVHLYHEYANYRHRVLRAGGRPLPFERWRACSWAYPKVLSWHLLRYLKHLVVTRWQWSQSAMEPA